MNDQSQVVAAWLATQFPDLQNIQPLSRGGQKQVFSALHPRDGDVVLKLMHPNTNIERTEREVLAVARIQSSRVPKILGHGTIRTAAGDCLWFREQRILGPTVREMLVRGPLGTQRLLRLGLHVSETLMAAEDASIVHRDVKPDNIILDSNEHFWLIDFGLARHIGLESLTATANAFGHVTWGYAPPEQCRNIKQEIDARADLFALGVTLHECATGVNPFRVGARDALEVLRRVENDNLPQLEMSFSLAADFADLVVSLTQKRRVHRPQNAREVYQWVKEICEGEGLS